ncbi:FecR domain-containing protein [Pyxidicoccus xibeiensis]|uniref:FecR domain-containing protein n=1 Tax=Pyxidicoccus xibeiensis TaxID=2906759 RepID=UPI00225E3214|nr:FecR domain-containing protein [Pyxidicoccus xibeiensis]
MARHEAQALWALAAEELEAADRARVEAHVAGCPACARELEQVKQSRAVLHATRDVTPEVRWDAVGAGLRAAAAQRLAAPPRARIPWVMAFAGACAAMLGLWMLRPVQVVPTAPTEVVATRVEPEGATPVSGAPEAMVTARAESTSGAMLREAGGEERALQPGVQLRSGVAVRTPKRSTALLRLPDASRVRLSAGSEVELSRAETRDVHLKVKEGRLSVQASHAERRGFLVEAAGLRVSVVGTVFTVERTPHGAAVAVAEGRVRVEVDGQPARLVSAGERVELHSEERTLKQQPVSEPDQRAFEELNAPVPLETVPIAAMEPESRTGAVPAVARAPQAPSAVKPAVATQAVAKDGRSQVASASLRTGGREPPRVAEPAPEVAEAPAPVQASVAVAAAQSAPATVSLEDPSQEFAPYPAASVTEHLPPKTAQAPLPPPAEVVAERPQPKKQKEALIPMALMSKDSDERFLGYARLQLSPRTCESFLVGLEEIARKSPRETHREQARYLRARCFEEKLQPGAAQGEYRQYLNEFPRGRYVREANTALLP